MFYQQLRNIIFGSGVKPRSRLCIVRRVLRHDDIISGFPEDHPAILQYDILVLVFNLAAVFKSRWFKTNE